ncbi:MAG: hypothetical protein QOE05_3796 [Actinomycetota bacterium]|jgi:hypothetical protein|nr:hypothetical protein [Actinomycetota bacterium]
MTDQLPSASDPDENPFAPAGDDELVDPWHDNIVEAGETFGAPEVQSLVAFVLSVLAMIGLGVMNGTAYVFTSLSAATEYKTRNVVGALLSAGFALLPIVLGWRVSARVLESDPRWVATLARAAVILGLLALFLRLALAVVSALAQDPRPNFAF